MRHRYAATWAIVRKDLALSLRRPSVIAVTIVPVFLLLLVLVLQSAAVTEPPVAVVNLDQGPAATAITRAATGFGGFRTRVLTAAQASREYADLEVSAVLTIPPGFSAAIARGDRRAVGWQVRNVNADVTNDLRRGIAAILDAATQSGVAGPNPVTLRVVERDRHRSEPGLVGFQLVAVLALLLLEAAVINAGVAAASEWQTGSIKELLLAPVSSLHLVLGKVAAGVIAADVAGALLVAVATAAGVLPAPSAAGFGATLVVMTLLGLFGAALGVALGARLRSVERVGPPSILLSLYLFFLAGGVSAVAYLPAWVRAVGRFVPSAYAVDALRDTLLYADATRIRFDLLVLAAAAVGGCLIGVPLMRRGLAH